MQLNRVPALMLLLSLTWVAGLSAQNTQNTQNTMARRGPLASIASSASAEVKVTPDRARISISVQTKAPTAAAAATDNARKQNAVMTALRGLGLTDKQLSTTGYNVSPEYKYVQNQAPQLTGYSVTNTVLVNINDVTQVGRILDTALASGSNMISSLDFYSSDTDTPRRQALADAVAKAKADAEVAAKAAGGSLGALIHLTVGGTGGTPAPRPMYAAKAMVASAPETQINPGQESISASVSGSWRFIPNP